MKSVARIESYAIYTALILVVSHGAELIARRTSPYVGVATFVGLMTVMSGYWLRPVAPSRRRLVLGIAATALSTLVVALTVFRKLLVP